ncbi:MAG: stage III sporulation protein AA [Eubacteriales bacterium]|nr:stage III sporulation protein AA [Eubacteriales bacterium]
MYILSEKQLNSPEYLSCLHTILKSKLMTVPQENLCEIRIRRSKPIILHYTDGFSYLSRDGGKTSDRQTAYTANSKDISRILENAFEFSLYAHEDELSQGYITIRGGHRIGICGETKNGKFRNLNDISSLNYRIAHEHIGISDNIKNDIINEHHINNTLIISPPMCGKTSLLRDIVRMLSYEGFKVGVCDSRCEIAAIHDGVPYMDIADADILSGTSKSDGINMLLRTMSPDVIACDEIGTHADIEAISEAFGCGCAIIATAHCLSRDELYSKKTFSKIVSHFNLIITLSENFKIKEVYHA